MALADLEVSTSEAVFVGDTLDADVTGAKSVGMKVIYVKRREEKPIEEVQPDVTVLSLSEIPSILANW